MLAGVLDVTVEKLTDRWERYIEEAGKAWWKPVWRDKAKKDTGPN
jgi:hypothetical protein